MEIRGKPWENLFSLYVPYSFPFRERRKEKNKKENRFLLNFSIFSILETRRKRKQKTVAWSYYFISFQIPSHSPLLFNFLLILPQRVKGVWNRGEFFFIFHSPLRLSPYKERKQEERGTELFSFLSPTSFLFKRREEIRKKKKARKRGFLISLADKLRMTIAIEALDE